VDNPSQTERIIWKASPSIKGDSKSEVQLSAILPIELNKIILGYGDFLRSLHGSCNETFLQMMGAFANQHFRSWRLNQDIRRLWP
jgi:hypothetical protein